MKLATLHFHLNLQDEDLKLPEEDQHSPSSHNGFTLIRPPFHQRFPSWLSPLKRFFHPFPFLYFFWHIFLRCLHILCIKGKKKQEASLHKKLTQKNRKENNFCRIIFKDKRRDFLLRLPYPPKHTPNKKTRSMWLSREREKKAFFFLFGWKRYDYDIKTAATCWKKHKCLAMMEKSIFRWVTFYIIFMSSESLCDWHEEIRATATLCCLFISMRVNSVIVIKSSTFHCNCSS